MHDENILMYERYQGGYAQQESRHSSALTASDIWEMKTGILIEQGRGLDKATAERVVMENIRKDPDYYSNIKNF